MFKISIAHALRVGIITATLLPGWQMLEAQAYPPVGGYYNRPAASPADRTVEDLRRIASRETFSRGEHDRYEHAIEHLSEFSGKLYGGRFDRGKLDRGIGDVRNVLQHNRLDPRSRDTLSADLNELYRYRSNYAGYRY
jgi:hypothetical protein